MHVLKRVAETLKAIFRKGSPKIVDWYRKICRWVTGRDPGQKKPAGQRATGPGSRPRNPDAEEARPRKSRKYPAWDPANAIEWDLPGHYGGALIAFIEELPTKTKTNAKILDGLIEYLLERVDDIRYADFSERGITISSAPIESFHRTAQTRTKLPGQTWTDKMLQSILNLRVLNHLGRESDLWDQPDITSQLRSAFEGMCAARQAKRAEARAGTKKTKARSARVGQPKAKMMELLAS